MKDFDQINLTSEIKLKIIKYTDELGELLKSNEDFLYKLIDNILQLGYTRSITGLENLILDEYHDPKGANAFGVFAHNEFSSRLYRVVYKLSNLMFAKHKLVLDEIDKVLINDEENTNKYVEEFNYYVDIFHKKINNEIDDLFYLSEKDMDTVEILGE